MPSATGTAKSAAASKRAIKEVRDQRIETKLKANGFTAAQLNLHVNLNEFDEEASLKNQARAGHPLSEETVREYVTALENGDSFPPLIAWEPREGAKLRIVDGNHRFQAYKRVGQNSVNVYIIIGGRPQEITRLSMTINKDHGLKLSERDRIHSALYLIDDGRSAEDAAREMGLNVGKLRNLHKLARADSRAEIAGINMRRWENINATVRIRLNSIYNDEIFTPMAKLATEANLRHEDINKAVTELGNIPSFSNQRKYVEMLRETYSDRLRTGGNPDGAAIGRQNSSAHKLARMALGQIGVLPAPAAIMERMTPDDKLAMIPKVEEGIRNLEELRDALKA